MMIVRDEYFKPILLNMIDSYDDIRFESTSSCSHKITVASMELKFREHFEAIYLTKCFENFPENGKMVQKEVFFAHFFQPML